MKLTVLFLIACSLQLTARTYSQTVTLNVKGTTLSKVFSTIEKQTGFVFFYDGSVLRDARPVTIKMTSTELEPALKQLFADQPLTYSINEKTINVFKKAAKTIVQTAETPIPFTPAPPPTVHGRITNEKGEPAVGVSIAIKGGKVIGVTDSNGEFTLTNVPDASTLVFSAVNVETYEVKLNGRTELAFTMKTKVSVLDEVQIGAYTSTSKRLQTGNTNTVKGDDIATQPVSNPLAALEGRVPGLFISQSTGFSNSGVKILIQGQNSIAKGNDPFYVVDGVPFTSQLLPSFTQTLGTSGVNITSRGNPLSFINPSDIESITVLKDADATAIYGSRAANGAILITTKKGKAGQMRTDINIQEGWGKVTRKLDLMNTQQYLAMRLEAKRNDNAAILATDYDINGVWDTTRYTDWQKVLMGETARYTHASATISGGSTNTQYLFGATYHRETTVYPGDFTDQKGSVHFNINTASNNNKFRAQLSASYMQDNNNPPYQDLTNTVKNLSPDAPALYNPDGSVNWAPNSSGVTTWSVNMNPVAYLLNKITIRTANLVSNAVVSYQFVKGLTLKSNFGYTNLQTDETAVFPLTSTAPESRASTSRGAQYSNGSIRSWIVEPQLTYNHKIAGGKLELLAGTTFQQTNTNSQQYQGIGYASDEVLASPSAAATLISSGATIGSQYKYNAIFGAVNYNWQDKYILNLTGRRDGSSRYGSANRFHNFGNIGAAWIFTQENWLKDKNNIISYGKLRASYGTTGNDQLLDYAYLDLYNPVTAQVPYQGISALAPGALPNPYLQWEETRKINLGVDVGFWKDRILLTANYFRNRSSNQIINQRLATNTGFTGITTNFPATVQNDGWEFSLQTANLKSKNLEWTSSLNLTIHRNKLISFPDLASSGYASLLIVGQPITMIKTFHFLGVNPQTGLYQFADYRGNAVTTPSSSTDRVVPVNLSPKFYGGFENTIRYKDFELSFLFQFVKQNGPNYGFGSFPGSSRTNQPTAVFSRWQNPGDITGIQKYSANTFNNNLTITDAYYSDASYIRLKNLSFSWNLPEAWQQKMHMHSARIYFQGQNLLTITKYIGFDPETLSATSLPPLRIWTVGVQLGL